MPKTSYALGAVDPSVTSFSGSDVHVFADDREIDCIQGISFTGGFAGERADGSIIFSLFKPELPVDTHVPIKNLELRCSNELDRRLTISMKNVVFTGSAFGVSVDDLVLEIQLSFKFDSLELK